MLVASDVRAHPLGFAVVSIEETRDGQADVTIRISGSESDPGRIALDWPAGCDERVASDTIDDEVRERRSHVVCTTPLAHRSLGIDGPTRGLEVLVERRLRGGAPTRQVVHTLPASILLDGDTTLGALVASEAQLGAIHFALGIDHVLFVVGAFFLAHKRGVRAVAIAVTSFTIGHAITLALVTFGSWTIPTRPAEACIALSLVHVARELRVERDTLTRRMPAIACGLFGLVHGAGLASAMSDAGLRETDLAAAVASFNVGLELAELGLVLALFTLARGRFAAPAERWAPVAIGGVGVWLLLDRLL